MTHLRALVCLAVLSLGACAAITEPMGMRDPFAIQQPFQGVARNDRMLAIVTQAPAIVVRPIYGLGGDKAEALRKRVMTILRTHDVPALAESSASIAWVLQGQAAFIRRDDGHGKDEISGTIVWQLIDSKGRERAKFATPLSGYEDTIADSLFGPMADEIAAQVDAVLAGPTPQVGGARAAGPILPQATVAGVTGAPGDGNNALAVSLAALLPLKGIKIASKKADAAWQIEGKVKVSVKSETEDLVELSWRVLDMQGKELGSIRQQNAVPHKRLDGPWKEIAAFAAEAAAEGISQLIHSFTDRRRGTPVASEPDATPQASPN
ncbi:MAG: hypothetical protein GC190_04810 [Alphaproteobacteria bacterium]|nr:hypothetical protein [Alphaproteobacteria bacterium]